MLKISYEQTLEFIKKAHDGQFDKGGNPYWIHPYEVSLFLGTNASDDEKLTALLHDVVEDTEYSFLNLEEMGYSTNVIDALKLLTRDKSTGMSYFQWIEYIVSSGNLTALKVKYADNLHNSLPWRIAQLPKENQSIINRYSRARQILGEALAKKLNL